MTKGIELSIIVPCYNEELVLTESSARLKDCLERMIRAGKVSARSRIVFINDGSRDQTWELIRVLATGDKMFAGLSLSRNFGHQAALLAAMHTVSGDAVVSIDSDLQDDPNAIEPMVDFFNEGYDVVYGVRRDRSSDTRFKHLTAGFFYRLMRSLGTATVYNHADFRLLSRRAIETLRDFRETNLYLRGMVPLVGFRSTSVYYDRTPRLAGETKYPFRKMLSLSISAITSFSNAPLRLISATAIASTGLLVAVGIWVLYVRLFSNRGVPGWASTVLPLLMVGSLNLLAIGVVGEYVARIFDEIKARPRYIIAQTVNLGEIGEPGIPRKQEANGSWS